MSQRGAGPIIAVAALAAAVLGVVAWQMSLEADPPTPPAAVDTPTAPPPPITTATPVDAWVPPPPPSLPPTPADAIAAERVGLLGLAPDQIDVLRPRGWSRLEGDPPGWRSPMGTEVTFEISEGRVSGARARFAAEAFSSAASELTVPLIGVGTGGGPMLPGGEDAESMTADPTPRTGSLVRDWGPTLHWRLTLRTTGEPPFGPARLEVRATPFGADEGHSTP